MNKHSKHDQYIGMRVNKNIYSALGTLIIPASTILTQIEIDMLRHLNISLDIEDVEESSILDLVNSAIKEIKEVFERIHQFNQLPYDKVRERIIPLIVNLSQSPDLKAVLSHLEQQDEYTYRHSIGVALLSRTIGQAKGFRQKELYELTVAGFLHDVGKTKIPLEILNKPGKLNEVEMKQMESHTLYGYEIIKNTPGTSSRQALVALQHHEREDGSGYPYGIKGIDIDIYSKIVAVADVFHAMISKRSYKNPIPFYKVLQELFNQAFGKLEPTITLSFIKKIMDLTVGNHVILSNGLEGKIILVNANDPIHPLVEVNGQFIDLSKEPLIGLERII